MVLSFSGRKYEGEQEIIIDCPIHKLPVFIKAGAVLPMQDAKANTGEKISSLILHIYRGQENTSFLHYEDDGDSYAYQNGNYRKRQLNYLPQEKKLILDQSEGSYTTALKKLKLVFHDVDLGAVSIQGQTSKLASCKLSFFSPMEKYDPIHDPDSMGEEEVRWAETDYSIERMEISWQ